MLLFCVNIEFGNVLNMLVSSEFVLLMSMLFLMCCIYIGFLIGLFEILLVVVMLLIVLSDVMR